MASENVVTLSSAGGETAAYLERRGANVVAVESRLRDNLRSAAILDATSEVEAFEELRAYRSPEERGAI